MVHVREILFFFRFPSLPRVIQCTKGRYAKSGTRTVITASVTANHVRIRAPSGQEDPSILLGETIHSSGIGGSGASYEPVLTLRYGAMDELLRDERLPAWKAPGGKEDDSRPGREKRIPMMAGVV